MINDFYSVEIKKLYSVEFKKRENHLSQKGLWQNYQKTGHFY